MPQHARERADATEKMGCTLPIFLRGNGCKLIALATWFTIELGANIWKLLFHCDLMAFNWQTQKWKRFDSPEIWRATCCMFNTSVCFISAIKTLKFICLSRILFSYLPHSLWDLNNTTRYIFNIAKLRIWKSFSAVTSHLCSFSGLFLFKHFWLQHQKHFCVITDGGKHGCACSLNRDVLLLCNSISKCRAFAGITLSVIPSFLKDYRGKGLESYSTCNMCKNKMHAMYMLS